MTEQRIAYSPDLMNKVLNYLATKPFMDVVELINGLQTKGVPVETPIKVEGPANANL